VGGGAARALSVPILKILLMPSEALTSLRNESCYFTRKLVKTMNYIEMTGPDSKSGPCFSMRASENVRFVEMSELRLE
jgi:hypothetical protein